MMAESKHCVALALGSNLGIPSENFADALRRLEDGGLDVRIVATPIVTKPVDCEPGTPDFLNSALVGYWNESPKCLLELTQKTEIAGGRPALHSSRQARLIDIDILLFDDLYLDTPNLIIPHPRMLQRDFVLVPLREALHQAREQNLPLPDAWSAMTENP